VGVPARPLLWLWVETGRGLTTTIPRV